MKKIVFGITSLGLGGAERVLVDIANEICNKYDVTIFALYGNGEFESQLDSKIKFMSVYDKKYNELSFIERKLISLKMVCSSLRKKIYDKYIKNKFDVEVAFLEGPMTWIMSYESDARKIAWVHNDIEDVFGKDKGVSLKQKINKECYDKYNSLIFVSNDNLNKFESYFPNNNSDKRVIYNYLNEKVVKDKAKEFKVNDIESSVPSFVQVSRLVEQKAVMRLVEVHSDLIKDGYKHKIYIVGDGPLKEDIQNIINELGINDSFILLGKRQNPYPYIAKGDYFILTSYYEGYPMVLLEAKALNKYIMITDSAARETLIGYEDSLITENSENGIYDGIKKILKDKPKASKSKSTMNDIILKDIVNVIEGVL